jgi:hypothetical protein
VLAYDLNATFQTQKQPLQRMKIVSISKVACLLAAFCSFSLLSVQAQTNCLPNSAGQTTGCTKTITTAMPFLIIGPDSRSGALGEAGVAIANDANAMHWNPAALAFIPGQFGFSLSYSPWLRSLGIPDINLAYLGGYYNFGEKGGTLGTSLRYFSLGQIDFTTIEGEPAGSDKPNEFAFDVAYARKITSDLSASVALRYAYSRLASNANLSFDLKPASTFAADLSFFYAKDFSMSQMPAKFSAGINISNIGAKVSYTEASGQKDFIPTNLRIGYAFKLGVDEYNSLTFTNDFNKLLVPSEGGASSKTLIDGIFSSFGDATGGFSEEISEITLSLGMEYWYRELFAARVGYFYEDPQKGNRQFISLGAGVRYNVFGLDFSYLAPLQQNHPLQNTLRFTLTYNFDSEGTQ